MAAHKVEWDTDGLRLSLQSGSNGTNQHLFWRDVRLVVAYKKDCLMVDQLRLELYSEEGPGILVTEDAQGFSGLVANLTKHLPEMPADWYLTLLSTPAFDETPHILLKR